MKEHLLWKQKAYGKRSTLKHLANFLYEFIGARFTIFAFIALFNFAAIGLGIFDQVFTLGITLFLFYLISDAFNVFWTGVNLEYQITHKGIYFDWGVFMDHDLFIPFEKISKISAVRGIKNRRSALVFENFDGIKNRDYGFSKEIFFNYLSFVNVENLDAVIELLNKEKGYDITIKEMYTSATLDEKLPQSYLYLKFLQLLSLLFLYISTSIALNFTDAIILRSNAVADLVVGQEVKPFNKDYFYNHIETKKGYRFVLEGRYYYDHDGEDIGLLISPLYNKVVGFYDFNMGKYESLSHGYIGGNAFVKLIALFFSFISGAYIFYRRSYIPFEDLSVFLIFPTLILLLAFLVFN